MIVDIRKRNPALESLFANSGQIVFLDANFLIPPDRSKLGVRPIAFQKYREIWLEPVFDAFPCLAMHESAYDELVTENVKAYADARRKEYPAKLRLYTDAELNTLEAAVMQVYIVQIAPFSKYDPQRANSDDRGEVLSLAYMAVRHFLYFASNDNLPKLLIREAEKLGTGLQDMGLLEMFEVIFYLYRKGEYDNQGLRLLYKYQYHLTKREKAQNTEWREFIRKMNILYPEV